MKESQKTQEQHSTEKAKPAIKKEDKRDKVKKRFFSELAVVSFSLGILSFFLPLFGPLAVVLGAGGLMQIRRLDLRGKTLAILGIIFGALMTVVTFVLIAFGMGYLEQYGGISGLIAKAKG